MTNTKNIIAHVYKQYKWEETLVQNNGFFSLNLTKASVERIIDVLQFDKTTEEECVWIGCGDAREILAIATLYPNIKFTTMDINKDAITVAKEKLRILGLKNVSILYKNALKERKKYTHVYSTALAGDELYQHLLKISKKNLCMLSRMWKKMEQNKFMNERKTQVCISGSGEKKTLIAKQLK
tara:strand:- start:21 stop:566 length:546 start_codon:yes stop_codon:yes gene_type:complete